jgi:hypothetical protein
MPTPLELRLHQLSLDFARRVAGIVSGLTVEDLAALCGEGEVPAPKARRKKPKPKPEAASTGSTRSTGSTASTEPPPPPPVFRAVQPPEDCAAAFRRAEQERLETAVLKFVAANPGTDAEIVSQRVGLPKGKAPSMR